MPVLRIAPAIVKPAIIVMAALLALVGILYVTGAPPEPTGESIRVSGRTVTLPADAYVASSWISAYGLPRGPIYEVVRGESTAVVIGSTGEIWHEEIAPGEEGAFVVGAVPIDDIQHFNVRRSEVFKHTSVSVPGVTDARGGGNNRDPGGTVSAKVKKSV
jgi:hypothetical protein